MEGLLKEIEKRRARRAISEQEVPQDVLRRILTAATYAPSCANNQPWRLLVVNRKEALERLKEHLTAGNYWARKSPLIVMVLTQPELDCRSDDRRDYALFGVGLATSQLIIQATKEGLIAHPIAGYKPLPIKEAFGIPAEMILVTLVIIGYPGDEGFLNEKHLALEHSERQRKPMAEVVSDNGWGKPFTP